MPCIICKQQNRNQKLMRICLKEHQICKNCYHNSNFTKCILCIKNYKCTNCKYNYIDGVYKCLKHAYCERCKIQNQYCMECENKCSYCNRKRQEYFTISCDHKYCKKCIQDMLIHEIQICPNLECKKKFEKTRFEQIIKLIFQDKQQKSSKQLQNQIKCLNCMKSGKIISKGKPEYYKCEKCNIITCLQHNQLLNKCNCKCLKCLNKLTKNINNKFVCNTCHIQSSILQQQPADQQEIKKINNYIINIKTMSSVSQNKQMLHKNCQNCGFKLFNSKINFIDNLCKSCWLQNIQI